ncbi:MAG: FAD binding domain-containing protein [Desulfosarcina sp.]|nr:FAD binding domain-containing protein [Desulfosarcina sp.]MBC2745238.1 FAD binding domain-containing protein [Desulfosarcina sp.]MBC2768145.1 xanthine dehydrogenase family protein subunit M [Desulfosarcina sp.]
MPVPQFDYIAPKRVDEAVAALVEGGKETRVMAGGTDLLVKIRHRMLFPKRIVSLKQIEGLDAITFDKNTGLTIGATALLADVAAHRSIRRYYPTVADAAQSTANVQVRNMGTVVGNLCNASPSADNAPTLMAMGATVNITGPTGSHRMALDQFFQGPGITALKTGEIVTSICVPLPPAGSGTAYYSLSQRGKLDCSAVGVGTMVTLKGNRCMDVRLIVGACAPVPMRTLGAEKMLIGKKMTDTLIRKTAQAASKETSPITDVRASAPYRWKIVAVLTIRALADARKMALGKR